jgi:hypothetical protein
MSKDGALGLFTIKKTGHSKQSTKKEGTKRDKFGKLSEENVSRKKRVISSDLCQP